MCIMRNYADVKPKTKVQYIHKEKVAEMLIHYLFVHTYLSKEYVATILLNNA